MIVTGQQQGYTPGYINYDDLVEGALEGVAEHRATTRQRHLSSGNEDIASSYFATQYGTSKDNSRHASKQTSRQTSRRNSFTTNTKVCSNSYVQSTMATAAAKIAQLKKTERDDNIAKHKEQKSSEQVVQNQCVQQNVQHQNVQQESVQQQSVQQQQITQHYQSTNQHHQQQSTVVNNIINNSSTSLANSESEWSPTASNMEISQQQQYNSNNVQQNSSSNNNSRAGSRRNSSQFSYLSLLPEDGSFPHRTQPIGEPSTKRTSSAAPTPDREVGRKWSLTSSQDYINRTGKGNYAVRSNPIGLVEPSQGRDGYAVGRDGSMYRSTGNLNVAAGSKNNSRAGSEIRDPSAGNWKERRSSTAEVKGSGIRTGGNLIEPSGKPPSNCFMPFGSSAQNTFTKRKSSKTVQSSEQKHAKRERNRSISGPSGTAMQNLNQALNSIQSNSESEVVNVTLTRRPRDRAQSLPRGRVSNEESSFTVSLPGSRRQSRQPSVEPDSKKLSRHGSVEIFDGAYNLTVPNTLSRHASQTKLEEVHADHFFFPGAVQDSGTITLPPQPTVQPSVQCIAVSVHKNPGGGDGFSAELSNLTNQISQFTSAAQEHVETSQQSLSDQQQSSSKSSNSVTHSSSQTLQSSQSSSQTLQSSQSSSQTLQSSSQTSQSSSQTLQSSQSSSLNASNIQETSSRSRNVSGGNGTVLQGNRFNITNGLKRSSRVQSEETLNKQNTAQDLTAGSAFKILDSALQQYASQQQKQQDQIEYVAKVSSRQTSRKCSLVPGSGCEDVTTVTVSLPPSRNTSRINSRRGSVDIGKRSRRNSLDIFTADYSVKMGQGNKVDSLQQKTAFHMKVDNKDESDLKLCGRCHLPTHSTATCTEYNNLFCPRCLSWEHWEDSCPIQDQDITCSRCNYIGHLEEVHDVTDVHQRRTCVDHLGWEPFQTWFYEPDFRNWWQVTGCVGVPLYRVYPRKSEWRVTRPEETLKSPGNGGGVSKTDSVDDMIAQVLNKH